MSVIVLDLTMVISLSSSVIIYSIIVETKVGIFVTYGCSIFLDPRYRTWTYSAVWVGLVHLCVFDCSKCCFIPSFFHPPGKFCILHSCITLRLCCRLQNSWLPYFRRLARRNSYAYAYTQQDLYCFPLFLV